MSKPEPSEHEGHHYEWMPDPNWSVGGNGKRCRMKGCTNTAVAQLQRTRHTVAGTRIHPWAYCEEHLYGRRLENGAVMVRKPVKTTAESSHAS